MNVWIHALAIFDSVRNLHTIITTCLLTFFFLPSTTAHAIHMLYHTKLFAILQTVSSGNKKKKKKWKWKKRNNFWKQTFFTDILWINELSNWCKKCFKRFSNQWHWHWDTFLCKTIRSEPKLMVINWKTAKIMVWS